MTAVQNSRGKRKHPHLRNAPIIEAVLEVQTQISPTFSTQAIFEGVCGAVGPDFPRHEALRAFEGMLGIERDRTHSQIRDLGIQGHLFRNEANTRLLQFRKNGFSFSQLKPYESWESLLEQSQRWWSVFDTVVREKRIKRIGLRYINRLELPGDSEMLARYLKFPPRLPKESSGVIQECMERTVFTDKRTGAEAILFVGLEPINPESDLSIVVDVDVFFDGKECVGDFDIWTKYELLRNFKNDLFFGSVKSAALERYR